MQIGYFAQNQASLLDENLTVLQTIDDVAKGEIRNKIRDLLEMGSGWHEWPLMIFTVFGQCVAGGFIAVSYTHLCSKSRAGCFTG